MTNPYFMNSVSWNYPDGPAIAYSFLALASFLRPYEGRIPNSALGGACLALSGYANLAGLPVLLGIICIVRPGHAWLCGRRKSTRHSGLPVSHPCIGSNAFAEPNISHFGILRTPG